MGEKDKKKEHFHSLLGVLWDYDGVLVHSDEVKWRVAWEYACAGEDRALLCAIRGALATAEGRHLSRAALVDAALAVMHEQGVVLKSSRETLLARFGEGVRRGIIAVGPAEGALAVLDALNKAGAAQYLISGTPQEDLDYTAAALGIAPHMRAVCGGSGEDKVSHAKKAIAAWPSVERWFVVGDQLADLHLAQEVGASFIGVATATNKWEREHPLAFPVVRTLSEVLALMGVRGGSARR